MMALYPEIQVYIYFPGFIELFKSLPIVQPSTVINSYPEKDKHQFLILIEINKIYCFVSILEKPKTMLKVY